MTRSAKPLTDLEIRKAEPRPDGKPLKLADGAGLALWVLPSGKYWRLKYRFAGKEKVLAIGVYPAVKAAEARQRRDDAKRLLRDGLDPGAERKEAKARQRLAGAETFEALAREWLQLQKAKLAPATYAKAEWMLTELACPYVGSRPIAEIKPPELLDMLRRIEARGAHETAHRTKQRCSQVFRYAISTGRAERDPSADLRGALAPVVSRSRAAVTDPVAVGALMRAIDTYQGRAVTAYALKLAPLLFVRPGELRAAEWSEIDLDAAEWRIPAERMKMREAHIVPLSRQALAILRDDLRPLTGHRRFVFPSLRSAQRPMSENTITAALRRLGYDGSEMTGHGFRAMASTLLNEMGWTPDLIERQLAHAERNRVRAAYNRAQYLGERRRMMQAWADHLETLKNGATAVVIGGPAR